MTDLLSQIQSATEGSRELSDQVLLACGWEYEPKRVSRAWYSPDGTWQGFKGRPDPSRNLQDAVSLKTATQELTIAISDRGSCHVLEDGIITGYATAATAPLAVCEAIIKAHESKAEAA